MKDLSAKNDPTNFYQNMERVQMFCATLPIDQNKITGKEHLNHLLFYNF